MKIDKKFTINLQGNEFITFEGLLNAFHQNKGTSIRTYELKGSTPARPLFKAIVEGEKGKYYGHGDADDTNVGKMISRHKYRMAETRAIARALRWYNNIGMCSAEELGEGKVEKTKRVERVIESVQGECTVDHDKLKVLVVAKEGPNKGRKFQTCKVCKMFRWLPNDVN